MNYIGEGRYGGIISNTAGGYSFDRDPRNRRVTRYRYNSVPEDQPGRYVYLRDQETGKYWSPTWQPVRDRVLDKYECRHGPGYSRIRSEFHGVKAETLYFVPRVEADDPCPCEIWILRVRNNSKRKKRLRSFSYIELSFHDAMTDQTNMDWSQHIFRSTYESGVLYAGTQFQPTFPPGAKENAGIFCHANPWAIIACARLDQGDRAYAYYQQMLPLTRGDVDRAVVEPYVYCGNICGLDHPQYGRCRNSWLSGTATWMYVAATQWILGIRPTFAGLRIAPVIPDKWRGFSAVRVFRGVTYRIEVKRTGKGNSVTLTVNGLTVDGDVVPLPAGTEDVRVEAVLS